MQNKGYLHPYGSTLIPNVPPVVKSNGTTNKSVIPGAIGVAGVPRAYVEEIAHQASTVPHKSEIARIVETAIDDIVDVLAQRVADRLMLILPTMLADATAPSQKPEPKPDPELPSVIPPEYAEAIPDVAGSTLSDPVPDQSRIAHEAAQVALEAIEGVKVERAAPLPPGVILTRRSDRQEAAMTVYHASFGSPRFPVEAEADRYMVILAGRQLYRPWFSPKKIGYDLHEIVDIAKGWINGHFPVDLVT